MRVVGVIAGDDSLDLAEHADALQSGDYVLFDSASSEIVRLRANLEPAAAGWLATSSTPTRQRHCRAPTG